MIDLFAKIWVVTIPITSFVLIPTVKGTLISYMLAIISPFIVMVANRDIRKKYNGEIATLFFVIVSMILVSQMFLMLYNEHDFLRKMILIDKVDVETVLFRGSIFTQTLYLALGVITFAFFRSLYKKTWDRWIFIGGAVLSIYGIYEVIYYLVFGTNGDFLSNRLVGDIANEEVAGLFQTMNVGGVSIMRLKSLTGEPSMYAFTMLAYWIYAIHRKEKIYAVLFFSTLCLSTSTSAFFGIAIYLILRVFYYGFKDKLVIAVVILLSIILILFYAELEDFIQEIFVRKLIAENFSGEDRTNNIINCMEYFIDMPIGVKFFGVGFGNIRSTEFFFTLLINTGMIGFAIWTGFLFKPLFSLSREYFFVGLKCIFLVDYVIMMIAVPEFSYLFLWMFLGIAYNQMDRERYMEYLKIDCEGNKTSVNT